MTSSSSPSTTNGSEFKYIQDFDFLFNTRQGNEQQQQQSTSTCEVLNVKPLNLQPGVESMRSRQHLEYEIVRQFHDSNKFDQWWTHENNCKGWIFNTIYKKKTEDEVHVYRCYHKRCSCRVRVVFVANSCDVRVEYAIIEHNHNEENFKFKVDSIKTLSPEVKSKISILESMGMTATKIRRHLFKESSGNASLPSLKQIQNYIARLRTIRRPCQSSAEVTAVALESSASTSNGRKRGRPRKLDQQQEDMGEMFRALTSNFIASNKIAFTDVKKEETPKEEDQCLLSGTQLTEEEVFEKLNEFLKSQPLSKLPADKIAMKRVRLQYHFERNFESAEAFQQWWKGPRSEGMIHNSTYLNNAGDKIDIYRCSKRDCHHRVRVVFNPSDKTVCVERTDIDHDLSIHEAKTMLTKQAKTTITELFNLGLKPKAIQTHFLQAAATNSSEIPTMTQIKNLVNRLKIKQKTETPSVNLLDLNDFSCTEQTGIDDE